MREGAFVTVTFQFIGSNTGLWYTRPFHGRPLGTPRLADHGSAVGRGTPLVPPRALFIHR